MRIYIADKMPDKAVAALEKPGVMVTYQPAATSADLDRGLEDAIVLIVRSTVVTESCIKNSPNLTLIIRAGAGVNNIDQTAASKAGVFVANCPGQNAIAVAELTLGLIISLDRRIPDNIADFRIGKWNKAKYSKADGLYGKTLGIIGVGQIGREVIRRAHAFGMPVVAWSRSLTPDRAEELDVQRAEQVREVASRCDILSIHVALSPETRGLVSKDVLAALNDGAMVINTSRAEVVDEDALFDEVASGRLRAGLDVFSEEPEGKSGTFNSRFAELEHTCVTHHIGASTEQAQMAVAMDAIDIVRGYMLEGRVRNWINRCDHTDAPWKLIVRHYDKPGVIANVMSELKNAGINTQELENVIFEGKETACCTIQLDVEPNKRTMSAIRSRDQEVISAVLLPAMK